MLSYTTKLGQFRKSSTAITKGKMMQYLPNEGLYVYFRYDQKQTVMCVMNTSEQDRMVDFSDYAERTNGFDSGKDVVSGKAITKQFTIPALSMQVIELNKK
jgi:glycosidase